MKFDREEISDIGRHPILLAKEILRQGKFGNVPTPLEAIAEGLGIYDINETNLSSIEGALIVPIGKYEGSILINENQDPRRKRFTLAHELGHYTNPCHHPNSEGFFECDKKDMYQKSFNAKTNAQLIELEANQFASELLLPSTYADNFVCDKSNLDIEKIIELSDSFNVSRSATFRKVREKCPSPMAVIYSHEKQIKSLDINKPFPFMNVWVGNELPESSISNKFDGEENTVSQRALINQSVWTGKNTNRQFVEQVFVQESEFRITLITPF